MSNTPYDPELFIESTVRCLKEYLENVFQAAVNDGQSFVGTEAYEIVAEFPGSQLDTRRMPLDRTLIHFEIDDIQSDVLGFDTQPLTEDFNPTTGQTTGRYGEVHLFNIDVGIWATDRSGGTTARMRAKQILQNSLGGIHGILKLRSFSEGPSGSSLEIMGFTGGRFMVDRINDQQVYRMIDCTLVLRVYSRVPLDDTMTGPAIIEIPQDPDIKIEENGSLIPIE